MKDQYNNEMPDHLLVLHKNLFLVWPNQEQLDKINQLDWYNPLAGGTIRHDVIFVSQDKLMEILQFEIEESFSPYELGIEPSFVEWLKIDNCLKRCNEQDGFYHA